MTTDYSILMKKCHTISILQPIFIHTEWIFSEGRFGEIPALIIADGSWADGTPGAERHSLVLQRAPAAVGVAGPQTFGTGAVLVTLLHLHLGDLPTHGQVDNGQSVVSQSVGLDISHGTDQISHSVTEGQRSVKQ